MDARYQPPWPLGLILQPATLSLYAGIHRLLLRLHWLAHTAQRSRERVRAAAKGCRRGHARQQKLSPLHEGALRGAHALLHRLAYLASLLLQHVALQTDGEPWAALRGLLDEASSSSLSMGAAGEGQGQQGQQGAMTVDGLRAAHAAYIAEVAARCFVPPSPLSTATGSGDENEDGGGTHRAHREMEGLVAFVAAACQALEDAMLPTLLSPSPDAPALLRALALRVSQVRARLRVRVARLAEEVCALRLREGLWSGGGGVGGGMGRRDSGYADSLVRGLEDVLEAGRC